MENMRIVWSCLWLMLPKKYVHFESIGKDKWINKTNCNIFLIVHAGFEYES
jgi:hypothetical protein